MTLPTPNSAMEKKLKSWLTTCDGRGDLRAEVIDEQTPRDEAQQQKQQTGPEGVGHIQ